MYVSIKHKIALTLFVTVFLLTLLINAFQQYLNYQAFQRHIRKDAEAAVQLAINQANDWFGRNMTAANLLGLEMERRVASSQDLETAFPDAAGELDLASAYAGLDDGRFVTRAAGGGAAEKEHFKEAAWYREAKTSRKTFFIGPYEEQPGAEYKLTFGAPLFDTGRLYVQGAVAFDRPVEDLKQAVSGIFINAVSGLEVFPAPEGKFILFVKAQGLPEADWAFFREGVRGTMPVSGSVVRARQDQYLLVHEAIPETPMTIYYPISISGLIQPIVLRMLVIAATSAAAFFLIFQFALFFIGRYVKRIQALNDQTKRVAAGDFNVTVEKSSQDEIGDLAVSFQKMAESLVAYMAALKESIAARERLNRELELAAEIQRQALPAFIPEIEGLDIAAKTLPAYEVGGDYYDFLFPESGKVGFVVADAAGKGFPGTLFMTNSRSVLRVISTDEKEPGRLLEKMNHFIATSSTSGMFITVLYCLYEIKARTLTYANAGHYAPLVFRSGRKEFLSLKESGMPIGVSADENYAAERIQLVPGDVVTLFTDGVVEANNDRKEMFGLPSVMKIIREEAHRSASEISNSIEAALKNFAQSQPPFDDMTLLVMKIN